MIVKAYDDWDKIDGVCDGCGWRVRIETARTEPLCLAGKMPYVSIDLETTGLDPDTCQILEIGAVFDDWTKPIDKLPVYHRYVQSSIYTGEPYGLALNEKILKRLAGTPENNWLRAQEVAEDFIDWLQIDCGWPNTDDHKITATGKNFASFDLPFLKKVGRFPFAHRVLDPAPLYYRPLEDEGLPDTKTCMERAGMDGKVAHTAVEDALAVVTLVRYALFQRKPL
jgi:oligoribonuclease